jgi:hypothetical protein
LHVFFLMCKIDSKDKCIHKHRHDRIIYNILYVYMYYSHTDTHVYNIINGGTV